MCPHNRLLPSLCTRPHFFLLAIIRDSQGPAIGLRPFRPNPLRAHRRLVQPGRHEGSALPKTSNQVGPRTFRNRMRYGPMMTRQIFRGFRRLSLSLNVLIAPANAIKNEIGERHLQMIGECFDHLTIFPRTPECHLNVAMFLQVLKRFPPYAFPSAFFGLASILLFSACEVF